MKTCVHKSFNLNINSLRKFQYNLLYNSLLKHRNTKVHVYHVQAQFSERSVLKTDHRLRTTDCQLGIKRGLWTMFTKTALLRKVKLRETECGLALNSCPSSLPCTQTFLWPAAQSILCKVSVIWRRKAYCSDKEGYASTQAN